ncbi:MAG: hypothetical protein KJ000_25860 [Pirellulaceae bacterium]|nr:hypothetical protein [Pirellulaceae bacterium]
MSSYRKTVTAFAVAAGLVFPAAVCAAEEPLAVFECREYVGRDWPRTLVTYQQEFGRGRVRPGEGRLLDSSGREQPVQFWRVDLHEDGSLASARVSFFAELTKGGSYRYELHSGAPAAVSTVPSVRLQGTVLTLDNGVTAIRLPGGQRQFAKPLVMVGDRGTAIKHLDRLEDAGIASGPIAGIRLADGRWTGGSYFAAESIEAVRFRQKSRASEPDPGTLRAALEKAPKVTGYETRVTEQGPLFAEATIRFEFDNGGDYRMTVRALAGDPALRVDELVDLKTNCPDDDPLYVALLLSDGWKQGGWKPDAALLMTTRRQDKCGPFEQALQQHGYASRYASAAVDYGRDRAELTDVVPHDVWSERAHYFGLVQSAELRANKAAAFLGVVPMHAGSWRAAHWVFPPKSPHLFQQVLSYADGSLELRWTMRAQPHPQNLLHTGEFDPEFGLTGMRRLWCLVGGPFQYHDTLYPLRAYEGSVNLDNYKDWNLAWSDETRAAQSVPLSSDDANSGPIGHLNVAFICDDPQYAWASHYRQAEKLTWAVDLKRKLQSSSLSAAERGHIRRNIAAFCYMISEPDLNTRASMTHQGNPNMPVNRFFALPFAAALIPDHPLAQRWMDVSADYVRYKAGGNVAPLGAWSELITYYAASAPTVMHGALQARRAGRLDANTARLAVAPVDFTLKLLAPVDPRFDARVVPGFGHEGALMFNQWTPAAALIATSADENLPVGQASSLPFPAHSQAGSLRHGDPDLAAAFIWAWDQQKRPGAMQHDNGFTELAGDQSGLLSQATPELIRRQLASVWLPGFGAVLRAHAGDLNETYLGYRQGYLASHSDANQGDFVIYAKGVPLTVMSLSGYAIHGGDYKQLYDQFGWHSRVRFGRQTDDGGWPGGGPISGVHRHFFSGSADYLRGVGDYSHTAADPKVPFARDLSAPDTVRWTRQILFLKDKQAAGPNYFVFRDSYRNRDRGDKTDLPQTWWYQRTLGTKAQVSASDRGFEYASPWGQKMSTVFVQPARVQIESRDATTQATLYNQLARTWLAAESPVVRREGEANCTVAESMTVTAAGPMAPGQDAVVVIYPRGNNEAAPRCEPLAEGAARIVTSNGTDYVFVSLDGLNFDSADVAFEGVAGAVRVFRDEVHLIVAEGAGAVRYKGFTLKAAQPATKIVPLAEIERGGTAEIAAPRFTIAFDLDERTGKVEQVADGVWKQTRTNGVAYAFDSEQPLSFIQDEAVFRGKRGGIVVDDAARTVRLVLLDGRQIGFGRLLAEVGTGPYDVTFHRDKVVGRSEGPGRFLHLTMPEGIVQLPGLTIGGISYAPGTYGDIAIVPVLDDQCDFILHNLKQPPVFRRWQQW